MTSPVNATAAGTVNLGDLTVPRLGFGAMQLPGRGVWGPPPDRDEAIRTVRRAVELGVRVIDSAWYYGRDIANGVIAEALRPYPDDLVLVTKLGGARTDDGGWFSAISPDELRAGCERDLRVLGVQSIPVVHLRWMDDAAISFDEALDVMIGLRDAGKIQRIGLSNVSMAQFEAALARTPIASVSNHFGPHQQADAPTLARCEAEGVAYLPFFPLGGAFARPDGPGESTIAAVADKHGVTPAQISIAWLLHRSPAILPIPGTSKVAHLEQNVAATSIVLDEEDMNSI
jgi:pyridoxine 4-dehydrogenase